MADLTSANSKTYDLSGILPNQETTDLVQLPAILRDGQLVIADIDLHKLPQSLLREIAKVMGGKLVWVWRRIVYVELETPLCSFRGCDRPVISTLFCSDHEESH